MSGLNLILAIVLLFALSSPAGAAPVAPVTRNADWTPVTSVFEDGVTMVLVPPGCFLMGTGDADIARLNAEYQTDWFSHESPQHEQCFDQPFWIDQTEVTQADFARLGGQKTSPNYFDGELRPVDSITWFEARDFCALRGARLPAEREWEYAARGPDGLVYPWGNEWDETKVVWNRTREQGTEAVGSLPAGASWVGALDMSGNVWEWTNSLFKAYPYDEGDGRESDTGSRTDVVRVLRGGSWLLKNSGNFRAAGRFGGLPGDRSYGGGFRCARSDGPAVPLVTDPGASALNPVARNADWTPVTRDFDGVPMVQVPPGCFMMGMSNAEIDDLIRYYPYLAEFLREFGPQHQQCFSFPFWIDQTEVTQAQFAAFGGRAAFSSNISGNDLPVDSITWFEARDFCALRGARLPTEREWEYAARGPDGPVYPWGNEWNADNVVWYGNSNGQPASVGSIPAGSAWVGALDMSGNVWEWTNSLYEAYPYDEGDGRESDTGSHTDVLRVLRGGSWGSTDSDVFRAAFRSGGIPVDWISGNGFRCARSS